MVNYAEKLKTLTAQVNTLKVTPRKGPEFSVWYKAVERTLKVIFGNNDERVTQFTSVVFSLDFITSSTPDSAFQNAYLKGLNQSELLLKDFLSEIPESIPTNKTETSSKMGTDIFIVHGHDNEAKQEVSRFIEKLGLEAIILHEQANEGMTIIEKIEKYSNDADFALVLYTACDKGRGAHETKVPARDRARQNVVFEHGYLMAKLGRENVCSLVKGKIETPNDISGVVYVTLDESGAWKTDVAKELKACGYVINAVA